MAAQSPMKNRTAVPVTAPIASVHSSRKQGKGKGGGRGSRSGANARKGGDSDEEILKLGDTDRKAADLVTPKKRMAWDAEKTMKVVQYLTTPERWSKVTLNLKQYCTAVRV